MSTHKECEHCSVVQSYTDAKAEIKALVEALEAWMKVESEMGDNHPCPDYTLRAAYRKEAVKLTKALLAPDTAQEAGQDENGEDGQPRPLNTNEATDKERSSD